MPVHLVFRVRAVRTGNSRLPSANYGAELRFPNYGAMWTIQVTINVGFVIIAIVTPLILWLIMYGFDKTILNLVNRVQYDFGRPFIEFSYIRKNRMLRTLDTFLYFFVFVNFLIFHNSFTSILFGVSILVTIAVLILRAFQTYKIYTQVVDL